MRNPISGHTATAEKVQVSARAPWAPFLSTWCLAVLGAGLSAAGTGQLLGQIWYFSVSKALCHPCRASHLLASYNVLIARLENASLTVVSFSEFVLTGHCDIGGLFVQKMKQKQKQSYAAEPSFCSVLDCEYLLILNCMKLLYMNISMFHIVCAEQIFLNATFFPNFV